MLMKPGTHLWEGWTHQVSNLTATNQRINQRENNVKIWRVEPIGVAQPLLSLLNVGR